MGRQIRRRKADSDEEDAPEDVHMSDHGPAMKNHPSRGEATTGASEGGMEVDAGSGTAIGGGGVSGGAGVKKKDKKKKKKRGKGGGGAGAGLSFDHEGEAEDEGPVFKVKKSKASRRMASGAAMDPTNVPAETFNDSGAGRYSKEAMAALKASQTFVQHPVEPSPARRGGENEEADVVMRQDDGHGDGDGTVGGEGDDGMSEMERARVIDARRQRQNASKYNNANVRGKAPDFMPLKSRGGAKRVHFSGIHANARHTNASALTDLPPSSLGGGSGGGGDDDDDEVEMWEREALRRGQVSGLGAQEPPHPPPPPPPQQQHHGRGGPTAEPVTKKKKKLVSVAEALRSVRNVIEQAKEAQGKNERQLTLLRDRFREASTVHASNDKEDEETSDAFEYFQRVRDYVASLVGCLREKQEQIREVHQVREAGLCDAVHTRMTRRKQWLDHTLRELMDDGSIVSVGGGGYQMSRDSANDDDDDGGGGSSGGGDAVGGGLDEFGRDRSYFVRRAKDRSREERERRRKRAWQRRRFRDPPVWASDPEDVLSDSDDSDREVDAQRLRHDKLVDASRLILADVSEEFQSVASVRKIFEEWKQRFPKQYGTAYASLSLPQVLGPFADLECVEWPVLWMGVGVELVLPPLEARAAPTEDDPADDGALVHPLTDMPWVGELADYAEGIPPVGVEGDEPSKNADELDESLVPRMVEKSVLPRLVTLLETAYDPFSDRQTRLFVACVNEVLEFEPSEEAIASMVRAPLARMAAAVRDVCVPLASSAAITERTSSRTVVGGGYAFMRRCLYAAIKLLGNLGRWCELVSAPELCPLAIDDLLRGRILPALRHIAEAGRRGGGDDEGRKDVLQALACVEEALPAEPSCARCGWQESLRRVGSGGGGGAAAAVLAAVANFEPVGEDNPTRVKMARLRRAFGL